MKNFICSLMLFSICLVPLFLFSQDEANSVQVEIYAPKLTVFDVASQVIIQQGYSLLTTNERIGLITTDYKDAKVAFGSSLLLSLMGREDTEVMITTNITEANGKSLLSIFPKARIKKVNRITMERYEEFKLSKKSIKKFLPLAEKIKAQAEQSSGTAVSVPAIQTRPEESKSMPTVTTRSAPVEQPKPAPTIVGTPFIQVKVATANIRQEPSLQSEIIKKSSKGDEYKIVGVEGEWYKILLEKNQNGYINRVVCGQIMMREAKETPLPAESKPEEPAATDVPAIEKNFGIRVGAGFNLLMSAVKEENNFGVKPGPSFEFQASAYKKINQKFDIYGGLEFLMFSGGNNEEVYVENGVYTIGFFLSGRYYITNEKFFVDGGLGYYINKFTIDVGSVHMKNSESGIGVRLGAGTKIAKNFEIGAVLILAQRQIFSVLACLVI